MIPPQGQPLDPEEGKITPEPTEEWAVQVSIIGCGRVGLVTGCCLAYLGHQVVCMDQEPETIEKLKTGLLPLYEPHLQELLDRGRQQGNLAFSNDAPGTIRAADVIFLCIGVRRLEDGDPDFSSLEGVARLIAAHAESHKLLVERSTMPVQAGERLREMLSVYARGKEFKFSVAANPQFLREGTAVADFLHPDRILLGIEDSESEQLLRDLYRPIIERSFLCPLHPAACPGALPAVLITSVQSAELIKHVSNAYLAMKISYANLISDLCDRLDGDIGEVSRAMGQDPRIGPAFLEAGLGFGGFRLPRDLRSLIKLAERVGLSACLLKEIERVNDQRIDVFLQKIRRALWIIKDKQIGVLGLSFKADTDDIRSSPAILLIQKLIAEGAKVRAYDPEALASTRDLHPEISLGSSPYEVAERSEALIIATSWEEFRELDWKRIRSSMARPLIMDGRNLLSPAKMSELGFEYYCFGRTDRSARRP